MLRMAESLLSLVMPLDRAAATVGDLVESPRGLFAFWRAVASAVAGGAVRQVTLATVLKAIAFYVVTNAALSLPYTWLLLRFQPPGWIGLLGFYAMGLLPFFTGYWMARWLRDREAGSLAVVILARCVLGLALWLTTPMMAGVTIWQVALPSGLLPRLLGALLARWMTLREQTQVSHA